MIMHYVIISNPDSYTFLQIVHDEAQSSVSQQFTRKCALLCALL